MSAWYDAENTTPGANETIVETAALGVGGYVVTAIVYASVNALVEFCRVDDQGAVVHKQKMSITAGQTNILLSGSTNIPVSEGDKFLIRNVNALTLGMVGASIFTY